MTFAIQDVQIVDRSALELYSVCPAQARFRETAVRSVGDAAEIGNAVHDALSFTTRSYVDSQGTVNTDAIADDLAMHLRSSRPDVQPEAIAAMKPSVWAWAKFLREIHPLNVIRFDGGGDDRSGQLAIDIPSLNVRVTSEVDLLYAPESDGILCEVDYKTGRRRWTERGVRNSFQMQLHALLVLTNYQDIDAVDIAVWNTRTNARTYRVRFPRTRLAEYRTRVDAAAGYWQQYHEVPPAECPTWPTRDKCKRCDAAALCPVADQDIRELVSDPRGYVDATVSLAARLSARTKLLSGYVDARGDVVSDHGNAYGLQKPAGKRTKRKAFYEAAKPEQEQT